MVEDYEDARINDNPAKRERLHKYIAKLADQIQKQEAIERETIPRKEAVRFSTELCTIAANVIKSRVDSELAAEMIIEIAVKIEKKAEAEGIA